MGDIFTGAINKMSGATNAPEGCFTVVDKNTGKVIFTDTENLMAKALSRGFMSIKNKLVIAAKEQGVYDLQVEHVLFNFQDEVKEYHLFDFIPKSYKVEDDITERRPVFRLIKFSTIVESFFSRELELSDEILLLGSLDYVNEVRHKRGLQLLPEEQYDSGNKDAKVSIYINKSSILLDMSKSRTYEDFEADSIEEIGTTMDSDITSGGECEMQFMNNTYKFSFNGFDDFEDYFYKGLEVVSLGYYKSLDS